MNCPAGKNWVSVDGEYKAITVSGKVIVVVDLMFGWSSQLSVFVMIITNTE